MVKQNRPALAVRERIHGWIKETHSEWSPQMDGIRHEPGRVAFGVSKEEIRPARLFLRRALPPSALEIQNNRFGAQIVVSREKLATAAVTLEGRKRLNLLAIADLLPEEKQQKRPHHREVARAVNRMIGKHLEDYGKETATTINLEPHGVSWTVNHAASSASIKLALSRELPTGVATVTPAPGGHTITITHSGLASAVTSPSTQQYMRLRALSGIISAVK